MTIEQKLTVGSGSSITSIASKNDSKGILNESCETTAMGSGVALKIRKPYTISKQREKWTEEEHQKFIEALKLYGRGWSQIEEYIGTKSAVQIRSHAQKFFSKVMKNGACSMEALTEPIDIPPPRPKRKPLHPYPRKHVEAPSKITQEPKHVKNGTSINMKTSERDAHSPVSVLSLEGSQISTFHAKDKGTGLSRTSSGSDVSFAVVKNTLIEDYSTQMKANENDQKISLTLNLSGTPPDDSTLMGAGKIYKDAKSIKNEDIYYDNKIKVGEVPLNFIKLFGHTVVVVNHSGHSDDKKIDNQLVSSCSILMGRRPGEKGGSSGVSCTGSNKNSFNDVNNVETNLDSADSKTEYNEQATCNTSNIKKGFYPYKRCISDREPVYTVDDRESQRIRVFL